MESRKGMKHHFRTWLSRIIVGAAVLTSTSLLGAESSSALIKNGDFEQSKDGRPVGWGSPKGVVSYPTEDGNTFMRISAPVPDKMNMYYGYLPLPKGSKAAELSWRWRVTDLKPGEKAWFDARILIKFMDAGGNKIAGSIPTVYTRKSTSGWQDRSIRFMIPDDAVKLEFMPALFNVKSGILDLDDFVMKSADVGDLEKEAKAKADQAAKMHVDAERPKPANWPPMLHVQGNRLVDPKGNEVWLQGVNVPSLDWSARGENVLKSTQVAIEQWKANVIRLPVKESYWFAEGKDGDAYKKLVDDVVNFAANRGAYVVIDLHRFLAPKQEFSDFWKECATKYKNHPAVLFDLMNEPHGTSWEVWRNGGRVGAPAEVDQAAFLTKEEKDSNKNFDSIGMQALVDVVRGVGAMNVVAVGGLDYAYDLSGILNGYAVNDDPKANGVMYSTHVYPWKRSWQKCFLDVAKQYPILVGEVGADEKKMSFMPASQQEDWQTWVPRMLATIQTERLNWTAWCFYPGANPRMLRDWDYNPTPFWGIQAKEALSGKKFIDNTPIR